jgi:outer membrane autotransporter protein
VKSKSLFRRRLAVTTFLTVAPFLGYGRVVHAAGCDPVTLLCSGETSDTQDLSGIDNAHVVTAPGFRLEAQNDALLLNGYGDMRFTDENSALIDGGYNGTGVSIRVKGDSADIPGAITITTNGTIKGHLGGINAINMGSGDIVITADGEVSSTGGKAIFARNAAAGGKLIVTTGPESRISGYAIGIDARNQGSGNLEIAANGQVTSEMATALQGIHTGKGDGKLIIVTGEGSEITGARGIYGQNSSGGGLEITANGKVTGNGASDQIERDGIFAYNSKGSATITTGVNSVVSGSDGIVGINKGAGGLTITANGKVYGTGRSGIVVENLEGGGGATVTTGAGSLVKGKSYGIKGSNEGEGDFIINAEGDVIGGWRGIEVQNSSNSGALSITSAAGTTIKGKASGIHALHSGAGDLEITVGGEVSAEKYYGIFAYNGGQGDTVIKIGSGGLVQGGYTGILARSNDGQDIAITNYGEIRNFSGKSYDRAIEASGGPATIDNFGKIIGTIQLDDEGDIFTNSGVWDTSGSAGGFDRSDFLGGHDVLNNKGTLIAANNAAVEERSEIADLEVLNNSGLITLVDGQAGDALLIGSYDGHDYVGQNGRVALDAALGAGEDGKADRLFIAGNVSGVTTVSINVTALAGANYDGIALITVDGDATEENFVLEGGVLNAGFFAWGLRLDECGCSSVYELYTKGIGAGAYEFAAGITGTQDIWQQTTGTLLQRQADLRATIQATQVTPVADFSEPVSPTAAGRVGPGFWFKALGGYLERDAETDGFALDRKQTVFGGLAGFDVATDALGDTVLLGLFGGYLTSDLKFKSTGTEWDFEGPTLGAYATYLNEAFFADLTIKADFLAIDIEADDLGPGEADTDAVNLGGQLDMGYKIGLAQGVFIEPQASVLVLHTEIDDIDDIFGGAVAFDDATSVKGRLGLRLGHDFTQGNSVVYSSDVTASVWQDFSGDNNATITAVGFPATEVADDPGQTIGDISLGFSMTAPEGWSGFLRGHYQFAQDLDAVVGNAGLRYAW